MYRENGKAVFPTIRELIREAETIGRMAAEKGLEGDRARMWAVGSLRPSFPDCATGLGYVAAMAIVETARENRAAELETANW